MCILTKGVQGASATLIFNGSAVYVFGARRVNHVCLSHKNRPSIFTNTVHRTIIQQLLTGCRLLEMAKAMCLYSILCCSVRQTWVDINIISYYKICLLALLTPSSTLITWSSRRETAMHSAYRFWQYKLPRSHLHI